MDKSLKNVLHQAHGINLSSSVGVGQHDPHSTVNSNHDYGGLGSMRDFNGEILQKKTAMGTKSSKSGLQSHPAWIKTDSHTQK